MVQAHALRKGVDLTIYTLVPHGMIERPKFYRKSKIIDNWSHQNSLVL